jgi:hypothetical protein
VSEQHVNFAGHKKQKSMGNKFCLFDGYMMSASKELDRYMISTPKDQDMYIKVSNGGINGILSTSRQSLKYSRLYP